MQDLDPDRLGPALRGGRPLRQGLGLPRRAPRRLRRPRQARPAPGRDRRPRGRRGRQEGRRRRRARPRPPWRRPRPSSSRAKADRDASASAGRAGGRRGRAVQVDDESIHEKKYARYQDLVARARRSPSRSPTRRRRASSRPGRRRSRRRRRCSTPGPSSSRPTARVKKAEADLDEAKANVAVAEAKLGRANVLVGYTKITSPYDGVDHPAELLPAGPSSARPPRGATVPLLTVARTDKVRVVTQVPDRDVPFTDVGDPAEVTLDALGGEVFKGKVSRFAETEDPTSRTMHTEIDLPNPDNRLRAGDVRDRQDHPRHVHQGVDPARRAASSASRRRARPTSTSSRTARPRRPGSRSAPTTASGSRSSPGSTPDDEVIANTGSVTDGHPRHGAVPAPSRVETADGRPRPPRG